MWLEQEQGLTAATENPKHVRIQLSVHFITGLLSLENTNSILIMNHWKKQNSSKVPDDKISY